MDHRVVSVALDEEGQISLGKHIDVDVLHDCLEKSFIPVHDEQRTGGTRSDDKSAIEMNVREHSALFEY